jgi:hypothetical protein
MLATDLASLGYIIPRWTGAGDDSLVLEAGFEDYCEREVDEVEWQGGRVYLHLGARRDNPRR